MYAYGLATLGCVAGGWMTGRFMGSTLWKVWYRKKLPLMEVKQREFFNHITRWRADPSKQSVSNPVSSILTHEEGSSIDYAPLGP